MTEQEKMLAGKIYDPSDKTLTELRIKGHRLSKLYIYIIISLTFPIL